MDEQEQLLMQLQNAVRETSEFRRAEANEELIRLPTGDGMALVFFRDPEAPVRCALELSRALRDHPELKLRMGIHSGPVYRVADINANRNVAGGGINIAQRVMDCCDAGHILVSEEVANVLGQLGAWKGYLHDLGEAEVKHSVRVHLFNLCTEDAGNSSLPQKLRVEAPHGTANVTKSGRSSIRRPLAFLVLGGLAICALVVMATYLVGRPSWLRISVGRPRSMEFVRLTNNGHSDNAAISPAGKYIAYVVEGADSESLWLSQGTTGSAVQIIPPNLSHYSNVVFSPDEDYIYFTRSPIKRSGDIDILFRPNETLYRVPTLGGPVGEVLRPVSSFFALSPDGRLLCFDYGYEFRLAKTDGSEQRHFVSNGGFSPGSASWSPDGKTIAFAEGGAISTLALSSALGAQLGSDVRGRGQLQSLSRQDWYGLGTFAWLSDGTGLVLSGRDLNADNPSQLWLLAFPQGEATRITYDLNDYDGVSLTLDSTTLVTTQRQSLYSTWVVPGSDVSRAHQITMAAGNSGELTGLAWTPDGKLLYSSRSGSQVNIWVMDSDGKNRTNLTVDHGNNWVPSASPDGHTIVFVSDRTGRQRLWKMAVDGSNPVEITQLDNVWAPSYTTDGKWIVFHADVAEKYGGRTSGVWKVPSEGGSAVFLEYDQHSSSRISPDGKMIALEYYNFETKNISPETEILSLAERKSIKTYQEHFDTLGWSPDARSLNYVVTTDGVSNIWAQSLLGGPPVQLTYFNSDRIFSYAWSRDAKQLAVVRGTVTSDIVLMKNFH